MHRATYAFADRESWPEGHRYMVGVTIDPDDAPSDLTPTTNFLVTEKQAFDLVATLSAEMGMKSRVLDEVLNLKQAADESVGACTATLNDCGPRGNTNIERQLVAARARSESYAKVIALLVEDAS